MCSSAVLRSKMKHQSLSAPSLSLCSLPAWSDTNISRHWQDKAASPETSPSALTGQSVPQHAATHPASTWLINRAQPHLLSTCCCSSCTFLHTSPAMAQVLPTLVKSAATLSVRRKPAALRFSMCSRHASTTPVGRGQSVMGPAACCLLLGQHHLLAATGQPCVRNRAGGTDSQTGTQNQLMSACG